MCFNLTKYFLFLGILISLLFGCGSENKTTKNSFENLTPEKIEDLAVLGKVWGFLKYYHPVVATGKYDWDQTLIQLIPKVLEAENTDQRNSILLSLVDTLGKFEINNRQDTLIKGEIKMLPDLEWINKSRLGSKLTKQLTNIKNAKRIGENCYVSLAEGVKNPQFKKENGFTDMKFPKKEYRLLCLFRYWNIIQYYFPYKNLITESWHDILKEFIPKFLLNSNELEYKKTILELISRIQDTHASLKEYSSFALENSRGANYAPIEITFVENKAVVTEFFNKLLGHETGLKIGDVIDKVNNRPVKEIIGINLPFTPASNYPTKLRGISWNLLRTDDSILKITYLRDGVKKNVIIKCFSKNKIFSGYIGPTRSFKLINSQIAYIYPELFTNDSLKHIIGKVLKTKGLIIDFRCYPADFTVFTLSKYLMPDSTRFVRFSSGSVITPGLFTMRIISKDKIGTKNKNNYKGKVIILVNEETQSSAEYHCMAFRTAPRAIVIGSTTAGADGNISQFMLPGGIGSKMSGIGIYYPDGRETQRIGIVPDILVKPTIKGIREKRDELLEKAIEIINVK